MHKVYLIRTHASKALYTATLGCPDGPTLVPPTRDPEHDACRAMTSLGMSGEVGFYRPGKDRPNIVFKDLELRARYRVSETPTKGPHLERYKSFQVERLENTLEEVVANF